MRLPALLLEAAPLQPLAFADAEIVSPRNYAFPCGDPIFIIEDIFFSLYKLSIIVFS